MATWQVALSLALIVGASAALFFIAQKLDARKRRRLVGLLLLFIGLLSLLSQVSFLLYPAEGSRNFGGLFGYYTAWVLFYFVGLFFFAVPAVFLFLGIIYFVRPENHSGLHLLYLIPGGLIFDTLLAIHLSGLRFDGIESSGKVGVIVQEFLHRYCGEIGTYVILGAGVCIMLFMMVKRFILPKPRLTQPTIVIKDASKEKAKEKPRKEPKPKPRPAEKGETAEPRPPIPELDFKAEFLKLLAEPTHRREVDKEILKREAEILTNRLAEFDVSGKVVGIESGPVISRFELEPAPGVKVNRISNLENDLALALKATHVRIVAPIPGKSAVGIEVPNRERGLVYLKDCLMDPGFENNPSPLAIVLGQDITGLPVADDISAMPHMLVAGTTGSGKSVCINTIIASMLYHATHQEVRFLMIDPKRLELPMYNPIPHMLRRAVTEPKDAVNELEKLVGIMEARYRDFARENVRDIDGYNEKIRKKGGDVKPYIVIIVDELADLMLTAPGEIEENITRLAQMSRAVGIHLVLATQRPSVDVITGLIKANFPCRIAFQVASKTDSRTILDMNGAESLLGRGDMLFLPPGTGTPMRLHGAYVSTEEVSGVSSLVARRYLLDLLRDTEGDVSETITEILNEELWTVFTDQHDPAFEEKRRALANIIPVEKIDDIIATGYYPPLEETEKEEEALPEQANGEFDPMFEEAARLVFRHQVASVSLLQRRLNLGYARAGRIIDQLESVGVVEPFQGSKSRQVLIQTQEQLDEVLSRSR